MSFLSRCDVDERRKPQNDPMFAAKKRLGPRMCGFAALDYTVDGAREGKVDFGEQARRLVDRGADGFKMLEGSPSLRKALGIALDSPVCHSFYAFLQERRLPLLWHVGNPQSPGTDAQRRQAGELTNDELYNEIDRVLELFPRLNVCFARFYIMSGDRQRIGAFLDRHPTARVDLTPGPEMYTDFEKDTVSWREFFTRYADRILFGTDSIAGDRGTFEWFVGLARRIRRFLESEEGFSEGARGLGLDSEVVGRLCGHNAGVWLSHCWATAEGGPRHVREDK